MHKHEREQRTHLGMQKRASSPESRQSMAPQISLCCLSQLAKTKTSAVAVYALLLRCLTGSDAGSVLASVRSDAVRCSRRPGTGLPGCGGDDAARPGSVRV